MPPGVWCSINSSFSHRPDQFSLSLHDKKKQIISHSSGFGEGDYWRYHRELKMVFLSKTVCDLNTGCVLISMLASQHINTVDVQSVSNCCYSTFPAAYEVRSRVCVPTRCRRRVRVDSWTVFLNIFLFCCRGDAAGRRFISSKAHSADWVRC